MPTAARPLRPGLLLQEGTGYCALAAATADDDGNPTRPACWEAALLMPCASACLDTRSIWNHV